MMLDFIKYLIGEIIAIEKSVADPGILKGKVMEMEIEMYDIDAVEKDYSEKTRDVETNDPFSFSGVDMQEKYLNLDN